jgi:hypothetical protein
MSENTQQAPIEEADVSEPSVSTAEADAPNTTQERPAVDDSVLNAAQDPVTAPSEPSSEGISPEEGQGEGTGENLPKSLLDAIVESPESWREVVSQGDEAFLNKLNRMSFEDFGRSWIESQRMIAKGRSSEGPTEQSSPEEWAAWREANGIPADPTGYTFGLTEETGLNPAEMPFIEKVAPLAHKLGLNDEQVTDLANAYRESNAMMDEQRALLDQQEANEARTNITEAWGPDTQTNLQAIEIMLQEWPEDARSALMNARGQDGRAVMNNVHVLQMLAQQARELHPGVTVVPNSSDPAGSIQDQIAEIQQVMRTDKARYDRENMSNRLMQLYQAQETLEARGRA